MRICFVLHLVKLPLLPSPSGPHTGFQGPGETSSLVGPFAHLPSGILVMILDLEETCQPRQSPKQKMSKALKNNQSK